MKVIFHIDLDSFFPSAIRTIKQKYKGVPLVISKGDKRSIISSASYEAREFGISAGMPFYKARSLCPKLVTATADFSLFTTLATQFFELIANNFTPNIEVASIDECYIDVTNIWKQYGTVEKLAKKIQKKILEKLDLPCSIGISYNKFLAKIATDINKPMGITNIGPKDVINVIYPLHISKFLGIGKKTIPKILKENISTIGDFAKRSWNDPNIKEIFGKRTKAMIMNARGIGTDVLSYKRNELQGIGNSVTFSDGLKSNRNEIINELLLLAKNVSSRAIRRNAVGRVISISLKDANFIVSSKQQTLRIPTQKFDVMKIIILKLFNQLWKEQPIRLVGITLSKVSNMYETSYQSSIFDNNVNKNKIDTIVESINKKLKNKSLVTGKEFINTAASRQRQSRYVESEFAISSKHKQK